MYFYFIFHRTLLILIKYIPVKIMTKGKYSDSMICIFDSHSKSQNKRNNHEIYSVSFSTIGEEFWRDNTSSPVESIAPIHPDKLAEDYRDLYHGPWSAAYRALKRTGLIVVEEEIIKKLSTMLHVNKNSEKILHFVLIIF